MVGEGDHPAQHPPELSEADEMALEWYLSNATGFVKDYNLMASLIDDIGLVGIAKKIFLAKFNAIHLVVMRLQKEKAKEAKNNG